MYSFKKYFPIVTTKKLEIIAELKVQVNQWEVKAYGIENINNNLDECDVFKKYVPYRNWELDVSNLFGNRY